MAIATATPVTSAMATTVVLYPLPGAGHITPMIQLADLFLRHGLHPIVILLDNQTSPNSGSSLRQRHPSISFHHLRSAAGPGPATGRARSFVSCFEEIRAANAGLRDFLRSVPRPAALVLDWFCLDALDVAAELAIPAYAFFTSSPTCLAVSIHVPYFEATTAASFKDLACQNQPLGFPGAARLTAADMPPTLQDRESEVYKVRRRQMGRILETRGILMNAVEALDGEAVSAVSAGLCTPGKPAPPLYCIGPLISDGPRNGEGEEHACLLWLSKQPACSVVFLCFGSLGKFSAAQITEIAVGLERSGHRFLWVLRAPKSDDPKREFDLPAEPDLDVVLPEGFLGRTEGHGLVVKLWVPQVAVLGHPAIGAFVTHCGWNSVLEAVTAGVPMICWPQYAEQSINSAFLGKTARLGVEMEGCRGGGVASAEEVEAKVRLVMESDEGKELKKRAAAAKEAALGAWTADGQSRLAFDLWLAELERLASTGMN